ncbi:MAG TPA: hypothetical protein VGQ57_03700, partial [Polyangiaceae bacterium]|nr:hypothetical protein [Polyangiaceae bacterium]
AVYVFVREGGVWSQQAYLKAGDPDAGDAFGASVAIAGDTLVVGAPGEDSSALGVNGDENDNGLDAAGAAYVFERSGGVWSRHSYLKSSEPLSKAAFGAAVAIDGDTLVVGASGDPGPSDLPGAGAAYVFSRQTDAWAQQVSLRASLPQANGSFGRSLALASDRLAVGSPGENSGSAGVNAVETGSGEPASGAAYVFLRGTGDWQAEKFIKASDPAMNAAFGASIALDGRHLLVGAPGRDRGDFTGSGEAYLYELDPENHWFLLQSLLADNPGKFDSFGASVAARGELFAVGAPKESGSATGINGDSSTANEPWSGAVYVFSPDRAGWYQSEYVKASNSRANGFFGQSLALTSDLLAVGAPNESSAATGIDGDSADVNAHASGATYVYDVTPP